MIEERCDEHSFPEWQFALRIKPASFWRNDVVSGCQVGSRFTRGGSWSGSLTCSVDLPLREMLQGRHSPFGRLSPVPGCDLLAGELRIPGIFPNKRWKKSRVNGRRPCVCLNDREGSCVMGFVPIGIDEFIKLHRKSNPGERPDEFIRFPRRSVADARQGARCHCGAPIWA